MSSSSHRSSSAVRDLRSIFENKASKTASYDPRGRSNHSTPGSDKENGRPTPKIRASFYSVDPIPTMSATPDKSDLPDGEHKGSLDERRSEFVEGEEGGPMTEIKDSISKEHEARLVDDDVPEAVPETAVESAAPTPAVQADEDPIQEAVVLESDLPSANPDKPVTGAEEEPGNLGPADPTSTDAVSGGDALPSTEEDLRKPEDAAPEAATKTVSKAPSKIATATQSKPASSSLKSPVSAKGSATSPQSSTASLKPGRSSLAAPTAASAAHATRNGPPPASTFVKPKPREPTRPMELSSRLTAPTAAFRAKHEQGQPEGITSSARSSLSGRQSLANVKSTPRSSLAGGAKPDSQPPPRKIPTPDAGFLERMMRPTAASQSKVQGKHENKSPGKPKPVAPKPKRKPAAAGSAVATSSHADESVLEPEPEADVEPEAPAPEESAVEAAPADKVEEPIGEAQAETKRENEITSTEAPIPANIVQEKVEALEAVSPTEE